MTVGETFAKRALVATSIVADVETAITKANTSIRLISSFLESSKIIER